MRHTKQKNDKPKTIETTADGEWNDAAFRERIESGKILAYCSHGDGLCSMQGAQYGFRGPMDFHQLLNLAERLSETPKEFQARVLAIPHKASPSKGEGITTAFFCRDEQDHLGLFEALLCFNVLPREVKGKYQPASHGCLIVHQDLTPDLESAIREYLNSEPERLPEKK